MPSPELENEVPAGRRLRAEDLRVVRLKEQLRFVEQEFLQIRDIDVRIMNLMNDLDCMYYY